MDEELREGIEMLVASKRDEFRTAVEAGAMSPAEAAERVLAHLACGGPKAAG
jgi:hypothetical protein